MLQKSIYRFSVGLVLAMHFFGCLLMLYPPTKDLFLSLTPLNLLTTVVLFAVHQEEANNRNFLLFLLVAYTVGYFVEFAGVHTGKIFGVYWYGATLGIKVFEIPLTIGINWAVLVGATGSLVAQYATTTHIALKAAFGASVMVALDYFIEPVAMRLDFWQWENNFVPLQNFVAWWIVAYGLHYFYHLLAFPKKNRLALTILIAQFFFFLVHFLVVKFW
jgi:putative membrane protein